MTGQPLFEALRGQGYRVTPQRVLVREVLQHSAEHLSAQDVHAALRERFPTVDLSTVYRVLELFVRLGLVAKSDLGEGRAVYEWCPDHGAHHHMVCAHCGGVTHFDSTRITGVVLDECAAAEFAPRDVELTIVGACRECRGASA